MATDTNFFSKIQNIGMLALGAIVLAIHVVIFKLNQYMFTVIMCLYIIGYTALVIVTTYKNKKCYAQSDFDLMINMSVYTVFLELFLIVVAFVFMWIKAHH